MSNYEIPCTAPTPFDNEFMFEVADNLLLQKDQIISQLQEELAGLKEFILEQRKQQATKDKLIHSLTNVVKDIVRLYPTFHVIPDPEGNDKRRKMFALEKGIENIANIVNYVDKFKNNSMVLQELYEVLIGITFENASYQKDGRGIVCIAQTTTSIFGFRFFNHGTWTKTSANGHDYEFGYLKCQMDDIILRTIGVGFYGRTESAVKSSDNIKYKSKQEHSEIWEHKKTFSKRMVDAISEYVHSLL